MNIYQYIAKNKPLECYQICERYGLYEVEEDRLDEAIAYIVANEGENAFRQLMELHPDKDIILEIYQPQTLQFQGEIKKEEKIEKPVEFSENPLTKKYFDDNKLVNQTNLFILVGALIVSIAIISVKK
jgi:hypothetical protein